MRPVSHLKKPFLNATKRFLHDLLTLPHNSCEILYSLL